MRFTWFRLGRWWLRLDEGRCDLRTRGRSELAHPDGIRRGGLIGDQGVALVADGEAPIEVLKDVDAGAGVADAVGARRNAKPVTIEGDGVIVGDGALVFEAEHLVWLEAGGPGAVGRAGLRSWKCEVGVEGREVGPEDSIGLFERGGLGFAEFLDESILKGAKEAFDAPLGLGGVGRDRLNGQLVHEAAELATGKLSG